MLKALCPLARAWSVVRHWEGMASAAAAWVVLLTSGCITRTPYPEEWATSTQPAENARHQVAGQYLNRGVLAGAKGGRRPVLLSDLLSLNLEKRPDVITERIQFPERTAAGASPSEVVTLKIIEYQPSFLRIFPTKYRESAKRGSDAADAALSRIMPVQRWLRFDAPQSSPSPRHAFCMLHPDGQVDVALLMSQDSAIILKLSMATDGALVGRLVDESGGIILMIPYYSSSDSWVRFEPAGVRRLTNAH